MIEFTANSARDEIYTPTPLRIGDQVRVVAKPGVSLPVPLWNGGLYVVEPGGPLSPGYRLAAWYGGPPIDLTTDGVGVIDHEGT